MVQNLAMIHSEYPFIRYGNSQRTLEIKILVKFF